MIDSKTFLSKALEIAAEEPGYQLGHSGDDHLCDCIGLIIGAIRRAGGQWHGTHGSNYAARYEVRELEQIRRTKDLTPGDLVFKAREPGEAGYALPDRYKHDKRDYYHVGVVVSVEPLRILHMTTPRPKIDTSLGKWAYYGWPRLVARENKQEGIPVGTEVNYQGRVVGDGMLNLRQAPNTRAARIMQLPVGTVVQVNEEDGDWLRVSYGAATGYVMAQYIDKDTTAGKMISVDRSVLEAIYDEIGDLLGLRG